MNTKIEAEKKAIADSLNAGISPTELAGYDADFTAQWRENEAWNGDIAPVGVARINGIVKYNCRKNTETAPWRVYVRPADDPKQNPAAVAYDTGRTYGVNGQVWDNA